MSQALNPLPEPVLDSSGNARQALGDVLRQQTERAREAAKPPAPRRDYRPVALVVALILCGYIWFGDPRWLRVAEAPPPNAQQLDAGARLGLYLISQRIEQFRIERHHLPARLEQTGPSIEGVSYAPLDDQRYSLTTTVNGAPLTLRSTDDMTAFAGGAARMLGLTRKAGKP